MERAIKYHLDKSFINTDRVKKHCTLTRSIDEKGRVFIEKVFVGMKVAADRSAPVGHHII